MYTHTTEHRTFGGVVALTVTDIINPRQGLVSFLVEDDGRTAKMYKVTFVGDSDPDLVAFVREFTHTKTAIRAAKRHLERIEAGQ